MVYLVPETFREGTEEASVFCGILYFLLWPAVGVLTGILLPSQSSQRTAVRQAAAAGFLASSIDHIFTVALRLWLLVSGHMPGYTGTGTGLMEIVRSEWELSWTTGGIVILFAIGLSITGCYVFMLYTRKFQLPVPAPTTVVEPSLSEFDQKVRYLIFRFFAENCRAPTCQEIATLAYSDEVATFMAFHKLHRLHMITLDQRTNTIRMANPFSAVATRYMVRSGKKAWWANCAWDALGIAASLQIDATIKADYPDIPESVELKVECGEVDGKNTVVYFPLPIQQWYEDLVFT